MAEYMRHRKSIFESRHKIAAAAVAKQRNYEANPDDDGHDSDYDSASDGDSSNSDDEKFVEETSKLTEWINHVRLYVTYQNTKALLRWLLDYAFIEIRVAVS
jgi:hypothetical protein